MRDIELPDPDDTPPRLAVYREWSELQQSLDVLAASYRRMRDVADGEGGLTRYPVVAMTASGFDVAGVAPLYGRTLNVGDEEVGAPAVAVISHRVWRSLLGAVAGLYSVMAFSVAQRTREIGIRLALGADRNRILGTVLRRGLLQIGLGLALGTLAGWALLRLMQYFPTGVASDGTWMLAAASAAMVIAGLLACFVPATRAVAVHPVVALRHH